MKEQTPSFTVVDKRKFTSEGSLRDDRAASELEPEPATVPSAEAAPQPAKIVTMPGRPTAAADDLAGEDMRGSLQPVEDAEEGEEAEQIGEPRSAEETAAQDAAYQQSSRELDSMLSQANPDMEPEGPVGFEHVIQSFYLSAVMAMGAGTQPGQKPRIDIIGARQSIDMLSVLEEKTRGNLTPQEQQLLQGITFELRMMFLELTNAISKQAQQPPVGNPGKAPAGPRVR